MLGLKSIVDPMILVGTFVFGIILSVVGIWGIKSKYKILRQMAPRKQSQSPSTPNNTIRKADDWDMQPNIIQFLCGVMNIVIPVMVLFVGTTFQASSYIGFSGVQFVGGVGFLATFFRSWTARARNYKQSQELEKKGTVEIQPQEPPKT